MIKGLRKLLLALAVVGVAGTVNLSDNQAKVLISVSGLMLGSNAVVHVGRDIAKAIGNRRPDSAGGADGDTGAEG